MSIEQTNSIDLATIDETRNAISLTISDHLRWDTDEAAHLLLLQNKLNAYLKFVESGEIAKKLPQSKGRSVVISVIGQYPLSEQAGLFFERARAAVREAGYSLEFKLL